MRADLPKLKDDPYLDPYREIIEKRGKNAKKLEKKLTQDVLNLAEFASGHEYYGFHYRRGKWIFREWAPNAESITLIGDFSDWQLKEEYQLKRINKEGDWEIKLPKDAIHHLDLYRLYITWPGGNGERLPAYTRRVLQDPNTKGFNAQVWHPDKPYKWKHKSPPRPLSPLIYECHVGMAQEEAKMGTYREFIDNILPRVADSGYNTIQLMAIMEHPYYASFGYHVANFFSASSFFGTPHDLKELIDTAHGMGLFVIMDLVHSHSVRNENEGLALFDGTPYQYFHEGGRGLHSAWDSKCFDYAKTQVLHFLLSNCRFWLDDYHVDGFRFDGITSMLYLHHGLMHTFSSYDDYFGSAVDNDAINYLTLANKLIHSIRPDAITIAEDVSGMPGLASPIEDNGFGFDYRLAMGVPDCWFKLVNDTKDEDWNMNYLWHELNNRRAEEQTISYTESHDQALVGGKTLIFELIDKEMYDHMAAEDTNIQVERGMAIHKMARLSTLTSASHGYLTFFGNEFGHPEWIDFPREGNGWSFHHARRQWSLRDAYYLKYHFLADFDKAILDMVTKYDLLNNWLPQQLHCNDGDKVLAFRRKDLIMMFNFHPTESFCDYGIKVPPGKYELILDSDEERFGGQSRIESGQTYLTTPVEEDGETGHYVQVYLPCRTALILRATQE
ncbi:1,4-alpha-glucan-branching enzyme [bacterium E08(2017)]|nr:1,4-alpha-glucan-branching enzyme [bacterium E08(2017)]